LGVRFSHKRKLKIVAPHRSTGRRFRSTESKSKRGKKELWVYDISRDEKTYRGGRVRSGWWHTFHGLRLKLWA